MLAVGRGLCHRIEIWRQYSSHFLNMSASEKLSYQESVQALNSLQSNAADIERIRQQKPSARNTSLEEFKGYLHRTGLTVEDIGRLSVIHVSGTKGKGSTCALVESILRQHGLRTGFFSSPHLLEVRERIRLNGEPIAYEKFADFFWHCYNLLKETKTPDVLHFPPYFRFLHLMALHVFLEEKVDVAIIEVGIGGRYDTTNIVPLPVVCGITSLGYDHTALLGNTLTEIAWHKAGILKTGTVGFTSPQAEEGMASLLSEAAKVQVPLQIAPPLSCYPAPLPEVALAGEHQLGNASLALQICHAWLSRTGRLASNGSSSSQPIATLSNTSNGSNLHTDVDRPQPEQATLPMAAPFDLTPAMREGLRQARWAGRCDIVRLPKVTIYLDGAHTVRSSMACAEWFTSAADQELKERDGKVCRVMIFNATGGRDPKSLLSPLLGLGVRVAAFCPNIAGTGSSNPADITNRMVTEDAALAACHRNCQAWRELRCNTQASGDGTNEDVDFQDPVAVLPSVRDAFVWLCQLHNEAFQNSGEGQRRCSEPVPVALRSADHLQVLVVGSLHLVGTVLSVIRDSCSAEDGAGS